MLPPKPQQDLGREKVFQKLGKSLIAYKKISIGEIISIDKLSGRIFKEQHIPVRESNKVIGCVAKRTIGEGEPIAMQDLSETHESA